MFMIFTFQCVWIFNVIIHYALWFSSTSLEMWSFEMIVLASGLLPDPELQTSVLSICLNTNTTVWMITYGLGNAVSTRVSNELGAGRPYAARLAVCCVSNGGYRGCYSWSSHDIDTKHLGLCLQRCSRSGQICSSHDAHPSSFQFLGCTSGCSFRHSKRMWKAKGWCICKLGIILHCGHSFCYSICFCSTHWRKGPLVWDDMWTHCASSITFYHYTKN